MLVKAHFVEIFKKSVYRTMTKLKDENKPSTICHQNMDKASVVQGTKIFNNTNVSAHLCIEALTKFLYYIEQGNILSTEEATSIFFSITKLFQFKHPILRRLSHVAIKSLSRIASDIIIATSCLMKDVTGDDQFIRASALRALCSITDYTMLPGIERYIKQAIVDRNAGVASAALVSSFRFCKINPDFIKRWVNEITEICKNDSAITQYHALGLIYLIKKNEKYSLFKFFAKFLKGGRLAISNVLLIRFVCAEAIKVSNLKLSDSSLGRDQSGISEEDYAAIISFLEGCLHNRSEMVVLEACRALATLPNIMGHTVSQIVSIMRIFLASPKQITRYCAVSTLCHMSTSYPGSVSECAVDLESLLAENNKGLATYAVTALLKIGSETNIDRVVKMISSFISEISEAYRVIIVRELRNLVIKFPHKSQTFLDFIQTMLREDGGLDYKQSLVNLVITIIHECSDIKEAGLLLLCEFIEDCDHPSLMNHVLQIICVEGPFCKNPSQFIRYIYNRIMLEAPNIRASAIVCLAQFAIRVPKLRRSILTIIKRCFQDNDDEVRDRACFYYTLINDDIDLNFMINVNRISPECWLKAFDKYLTESDGSLCFNNSFLEEARNEIKEKYQVVLEPLITIEEEEKVFKPVSLELLVEIMPKLEILYKFSHTTSYHQLSEVEEEFDIKSFYHIFDKLIVFEFIIFNTLDDHQMRDISINVSMPSDFSLLCSKGCSEISSRKSGKCFLFVEFPKDPTYFSDTFSACMVYSLFKFDVTKNLSVVVNNDKYSLDNIELNLADNFKSTTINNFESLWEEISEDNEIEETFALDKYNSIKEAAVVVIKLLGLSVYNNTDNIDLNEKIYRILLVGIYRTGTIALARIDMKKDRQSEILIKISVRCTDPYISENIFSVLS